MKVGHKREKVDVEVEEEVFDRLMPRTCAIMKLIRDEDLRELDRRTSCNV